LRIGGRAYYETTDECVVSDHEEVVVVKDDQISTKNTIRLTEPLISHANAHHGQVVEFNINPLPSSKRAVEANCGFQVSFERTPRMPDDNKLHQLPGSLGNYDLFSVDAYADRLPVNIREDGSVFFPMWQREAMWLNFETQRHKCAVRVFMGHVNAVSGLTMEDTASSEDDSRKQDYIVIPGQRWLDGICVAPGVVRQFVAMPRKCPVFLVFIIADWIKSGLDTPWKVKRHQRSSMEGFNLKSRRNSFHLNAYGRTPKTTILQRPNLAALLSTCTSG
jgi:hypothetical protein